MNHAKHIIYFIIFPFLFHCKIMYFYFSQPLRHQKPQRNLQKLRLDQLKNPLKKGHGLMWPRKLLLQRLKPALPARWPRMYKNNNDENLDKPCQLLEWYVKFKTYFIMLFKNVVINLYYYLGCSQKLQLCQDVENWSCFVT